MMLCVIQGGLLDPACLFLDKTGLAALIRHMSAGTLNPVSLGLSKH